MSGIPGGRADGMPDSAFDKKQLAKGTKVEFEHTPSAGKAKDIAKDHLVERKDYYKKLEKMEKSPVEKTAMVRAFFDELEKIAKAKAAKEKPDSQGKNLAVGAGGLVAGGVAMKKSAPLIHGRTRLYHGTSGRRANMIREQGLQGANQAGVKGVTEILDDATKGPSKNLAFTTHDKMQARSYKVQTEHLEGFFKKNPNAGGLAVQNELNHLRANPASQLQFMNPTNNDGILAMDVPLWRKDVASRVVANPEARGSLKNFREATRQPFDFRPKMVQELESKAIYDGLTKRTKVFQGGVSPEFIRGSRHYKGVTMREIGQYARAKPGRFGAGLALGAAGAGAAALGVRSLIRGARNGVEKRAEISNVTTAQKQHAVKNEGQLLKTLKPGDLIFSAPHRSKANGFMGRVFKPISRKIQGTDFGHTAMYVGGGKIVDTRIEREAKTEPLKKLISKNNVVVVRPKGVTDGERQRAVHYAKRSIGKPYSKAALLRAATPFQGKFQGKGPEESKAVMCSGLAANAYAHRRFASVSRKYIRPSQILASKEVQPVAYLETAKQPM